MTRQFAILFMLPTLLSGCLGPGGFGLSGSESPLDPSASAPKISTAEVSQMQRSEWRDLLGMPVMSSAYWGFDLFRSDVEQDKQLLVTWLGLPFAGVPAGTAKHHTRYTLVAHDQSGRGTELETGIVFNPSWTSTPVGPDFRYSELYLRAGEILFFKDPDWGRGVNILATPSSRDVYLQRSRRAAGQCRLVLGCGNRGCPDRLVVDGGPARRLPLRAHLGHFLRVKDATPDPWLEDVDPFTMPPWFETVVALGLDEGEHALEFSTRRLDGVGSFRYACRVGAVSYVVVDPAFSEGKFVDWRIDATDTMPAAFSRRPLVLVSDGEWYVEHEPKH